MSYELSNEERETIINVNDGDSIGSIYTCSKALIRKLDTYCKKRPDIYKLVEVDSPSKTYECPKKLISFRLPRVLTEKQKELLKERMNGMRLSVNA